MLKTSNAVSGLDVQERMSSRACKAVFFVTDIRRVEARDAFMLVVSAPRTLNSCDKGTGVSANIQSTSTKVRCPFAPYREGDTYNAGD